MKRPSQGFSLIELMTAITIGLMILMGLSSVFVNSSTASRELKNTAEQIENGRYAIELMSQDIRHAGFYGELSTLPAVPASADPCAAPTAGAVSASNNAALALAVQRVIGGTDCAALLTPDNLQADSDIVAVRRTDTTRLPVSCNLPVTVAVEANAVYLQTTPDAAEVQIPTSAVNINSTMNATGAVTATTLVRRDTTVAAGAAGTAGTCTADTGQFPQMAASIRKLRTHIYFVAPCSVPADNNTAGFCTGADDDNGRPIPTLKRLEMGASGAFSIVPIVEGIEAIRVEYGLDTIPNTADINTGLIGDGVTDSYTSTPSLADAGNAISARIYVLARNTTPTTGYVDDKSYVLGGYTFTPAGAQTSYKRHVYNAEVRIVNPAGRREIPR